MYGGAAAVDIHRFSLSPSDLSLLVWVLDVEVSGCGEECRGVGGGGDLGVCMCVSRRRGALATSR
ncbi:hypothetical protein HanIR_Chr02g0059451 [Helianthus annuus]|nr:hypothetical protein HanIR_Chr02g0059451 [Helianthus annuus]